MDMVDMNTEPKVDMVDMGQAHIHAGGPPHLLTIVSTTVSWASRTVTPARLEHNWTRFPKHKRTTREADDVQVSSLFEWWSSKAAAIVAMVSQ